MPDANGFKTMHVLQKLKAGFDSHSSQISSELGLNSKLGDSTTTLGHLRSLIPQTTLHHKLSFTSCSYNYVDKDYSGNLCQHHNTEIHSQMTLYCETLLWKKSLMLTLCRRDISWRHLGWTITLWICALCSDESVFQMFFGRKGIMWSVPKRKGASRLIF